MAETFEEMLTGGHPNSLGRTEEVARLVVDEPARIAELFRTYDSADEVVRLRVSSAFKLEGQVTQPKSNASRSLTG